MINLFNHYKNRKIIIEKWTIDQIKNLFDYNSKKELIHILIDSADLTEIREIILNIHETIQMFSIMSNMIKDHPGIKDLSFTVDRKSNDSNEIFSNEFKIPNWAKNKFLKKLNSFVFQELNWNGIYPKDEPCTVYR